MATDVQIYEQEEDGVPFRVEWDQDGRTRGMVPVLTREKAETLKAKLIAGIEPARAVQEAISPKSPTRTKFARAGGKARMASMTAEERSRAARKAIRARWAKPGAKKKGAKK